MKMWTLPLSRKSIRKLDPVLKQAGFSSPPISVQFFVKLFQTGKHVPLFNVEGLKLEMES